MFRDATAGARHAPPHTSRLRARGRPGPDPTSEARMGMGRTSRHRARTPSQVAPPGLGMRAPPGHGLGPTPAAPPAPTRHHPGPLGGQSGPRARRGEAATPRHAARAGVPRASRAGQSAAVAETNAVVVGGAPAGGPTAERRRGAGDPRPPAEDASGGPRRAQRRAGSRAPCAVGQALGPARPPVRANRQAVLGRGPRAHGRWDAPDRGGEAGGAARGGAVSASPAPRPTRTPKEDAAPRRHRAAPAPRRTTASARPPTAYLSRARPAGPPTASGPPESPAHPRAACPPSRRRRWAASRRHPTLAAQHTGGRQARGRSPGGCLIVSAGTVPHGQSLREPAQCWRMVSLARRASFFQAWRKSQTYLALHQMEPVPPSASALET